MKSPAIEQAFGRSRLRVPTGPRVEVIREAAAPRERRRYTKRFLATAEGDLRHWTAREARILAYLRGRDVRCVAELIGLQAGAMQTFDAGVTVAQWAATLPVEREGQPLPHVFADCAHWWALAHNALRALDTLHRHEVVHLRIEPGNLCVPAQDADAAAERGVVGLKFARLTLIDFAFALSPAEPLAQALPIIAEDAGARYRSPRLVKALSAGRTGNLRRTQVLDWRCDLYSLAVVLRDLLPQSGSPLRDAQDGWTTERHAAAMSLLAALDAAHDEEIGATWPHHALIEMCEAGMQEPELVQSLMEGFTLAAGDATIETPVDGAGALSPGIVAASGSVVAEVAPSSLENPAAAWMLPPSTDEAPDAGARGRHRADAATTDALHDDARNDGARRPPPLRRPSLSGGRAAAAGALLGLVAVAGMALYGFDQQRGGATGGSARIQGARQAASSTSGVPDTHVATTAATESSRGAESTATPRAGEQPPPPAPSSPATAPRADDEAFAAMPARGVEAVAARTESDVARVLALAENARNRAEEERVVQVARSMRSVAHRASAPTESPAAARRLNADARAAWERGDINTALSLQQRAFRANPNDAEVTGNLAFYYLKVRPAQPALARRLALYALAARGQGAPAGRVEDWGTLAVASSLEGRQQDAIKAMYVMSSVSRNPERACRAARLAVAQYGEAMRAPANAMLARVRERGDAVGAPSCG